MTQAYSYIADHARVSAALFMREMATRFGKKAGGYVWALLDPAAHVIMLTLIFQAISRAPALGTSFALFFATGYICFQFYQATVNYVNAALKANKALLSYPNVAPVDTITARYVLQLMTTTCVAFVVLGVAMLTVRTPPDLDWSLILSAAFLASLLGLGLGMINTVMVLRLPVYDQIFNIVNRPLFLVSGVFFLPDSLPHPYRELVLINPIAHAIMLFRKGFYPEYRASGLDVDYLVTCACVAIFLGLALFTVSTALLRKD